MPIVFEGLDDIDWASLTHAYGSASDVPALLRALATGNESSRAAAIGELFGNIYHQGTVYSASAPALPYLYELLGSPDVPGKDWIAYLIASIADGVGYLEVHADSEQNRDDWRRILASKGLTLEEELAREAREVAAVRAAASLRLRDLLPYLHHPERELRLSVASAFARYPEHASWSVEALEAAAQRETDEEVREAINQALDSL